MTNEQWQIDDEFTNIIEVDFSKYPQSPILELTPNELYYVINKFVDGKMVEIYRSENFVKDVKL